VGYVVNRTTRSTSEGPQKDCDISYCKDCTNFSTTNILNAAWVAYYTTLEFRTIKSHREIAGLRSVTVNVKTRRYFKSCRLSS